MGGLDELKVWEVVGEGSAAFCRFAEKVSAMTAQGRSGFKIGRAHPVLWSLSSLDLDR